MNQQEEKIIASHMQDFRKAVVYLSFWLHTASSPLPMCVHWGKYFKRQQVIKMFLALSKVST